MKLQLRGRRWHLVKRVPKRFAHVDARSQVWVSLRTDSEAEARKRAVEVMRELENLWLARSLGEGSEDLRFDALSALAASRGFACRPSAELATMPVGDISRRVLHLRDTGVVDDPEIVGAVLGGAEAPRGLMLSGAAAEFLRLKERRPGTRGATSGGSGRTRSSAPSRASWTWSATSRWRS